MLHTSISPEKVDDAATYARLVTERQPFLDRARENAALTIPSLMPQNELPDKQRLQVPWQSIGAEGVNTLTSKLVKTLLPANAPMFRFSVPDKVIEEVSEVYERGEVEKKLNESERAVQEEIEFIGVRASLEQAVKQLLVAGNVFLYLPEGGNLQVFKLDRYVVLRDQKGNVLRVIIKETVSKETLPKDVLALLEQDKMLPSSSTSSDPTAKNEVDIYTSFKLDVGRILMHQSIEGLVIEGSQGSWPIDVAPIMALRWDYLHNEDYGRSYVEQYIGDLSAVNNISKSIREIVAVLAQMNILVNPSGVTEAEALTTANNLDFVSGRIDDVKVLQFEKQGDLNAISAAKSEIEQRLMKAFMMNSSAQRNAERVTAEEVRSMISDIDDVLGGVYALLAVDLQLPLVSRVIDRMIRQKRIPDFKSLKGPDGKPVAAPKVITGVEALGRGHDYNKYLTLARDIIIPLGDSAFQEVNIPEFIKRAAVSLSIDTDGLLKSSEEKAQAEQQAQVQQQAQQQQQLAGDVVKGAVPQVAKAVAEGGIPPEMLQALQGAQ